MRRIRRIIDRNADALLCFCVVCTKREPVGDEESIIRRNRIFSGLAACVLYVFHVSGALERRMIKFDGGRSME